MVYTSSFSAFSKLGKLLLKMADSCVLILLLRGIAPNLNKLKFPEIKSNKFS